MSELLCSAADGTCELEAKKGGLCWGHYWRKTHGSKLPLAAPVRPRPRTALDAVKAACLEYRDELDTATDEEFRRRSEKLRTALRRYLWETVPHLLRRHRWSPTARREVEAFLRSYRHHPRRKATQGNP